MKVPVRSPGVYDYEIFPAVARKGTRGSFEVRGLGTESALIPGNAYRIYVIPQEENISAVTREISETGSYPFVETCADGRGVVRFEYTFTREQIYTLRLCAACADGSKKLSDLRVFCAEDDLYRRTPMRGNTHCHTFRSPDGHEDPYLAAAFYRRAGFDFLAITDHHSEEGSVDAIRAARDIPSEMALYPGEEVHVPNPYIHAVNIGALMEGGVGLESWYRGHREETDARVRAIAEEYASRLPEGIEPMDFAWRKWIADTVRENGGIAVIAHPFWEYDAHNTRDDMFRLLAREKLYDAAEIVHGQEPGCADANMQIAFWNDLRAEGIYISPLGADDAHRRMFAWDYDSSFNEVCSVVFALDPSFAGFVQAVRGGYTAAVESYENAPEHVTATYRLTKYTLFLLERYFPRHDDLCFEEGVLMRDAYLGDGEALRSLERMNGRVKRYTDRFFGRRPDVGRTET